MATGTENRNTPHLTMKSKADAHRTLLALSVSALFMALCSCMGDTKHLAFTPIGKDGWSHADTLTYTIAPLSGMGQGSLSLLFHTENYHYDNIALDIVVCQDTVLIYHELRGYQLEQNQPKRGVGCRCDYTLPVGNITLCDTMPTVIAITHRLDQPVVEGIREVGIRISAPQHQPDGPVWKAHW